MKKYVEISKERQEEIKELMINGICSTWFDAYEKTDEGKLVKYL